MRALLTLSESALSPFSRTNSPGFSTYVKNGEGEGEGGGDSNLQLPASNFQNQAAPTSRLQLPERGTPCLASLPKNPIISASK